MSGKPNTKWMETMIAKHGSREAVREHQARIGSKGGKLGTTGGFASHKEGTDGLTGYERASVAGTIGGLKSKRPKKEPTKKEFTPVYQLEPIEQPKRTFLQWLGIK